MVSMRSKLIIPSTEHKTIDGFALSIERAKIGLSQAAFADECGYSQQYQQRLESSGLHEITLDTAEKILAVLKEYNQSVV